MSLNYKVITRSVTDLKGGLKTEKLYASPVYSGYTELEDVCKMISERSTVSSADVKGVLDSLNYVLDIELRAGRIVRMGELGNFRLSLNGKGGPNGEKFNVANIREARIIFTPGKSLRATRQNASFSLAQEIANADADIEEDEPTGGEDSGTDSPGSI